MSKFFKGILSVLALSLSFSMAAHAEETLSDEENSSFTLRPNVIMIECKWHSVDNDYDVTSVTPANFKPVSVLDDCGVALSKVTKYYGYKIKTQVSNQNNYVITTLQLD